MRHLIATDGSELPPRPLEMVCSWRRAFGARVVVVTATEPWLGLINADMNAISFPIEEYERATKEEAARILGKVRDEALTLAVECESLHVNGFPAEAIIETAKYKTCDLIVMDRMGDEGSHDYFLEAKRQRLLRSVRCRCWFVE
jgi:nucleotide-binding universal stress UspA family protein